MKTINTSKTIRALIEELERDHRIVIDISHRGGKYSVSAELVVERLFPTLSYNKQQKIVELLPNNVGVYCNYLGGGLRGAITRSDYSNKLPAKYARRIDAFTRECRRRYEEIENEDGLNDEECSDGETNWDAIGTNRSRAAGVVSAY